MEPRDWLLLLLSLRDASIPLDPVRLQKGMFLLAQERDLPQAERYEFRAYDYGPFSSGIYSDLDGLVAAGLVDRLPAPGYTWSRYEATAEGIERARELLHRIPPARRDDVRWLSDLKRDVLGLSFRQLLRYVYSRHPAFAENSVFNG